jgi:hypothetical protein
LGKKPGGEGRQHAEADELWATRPRVWTGRSRRRRGQPRGEWGEGELRRTVATRSGGEARRGRKMSGARAAGGRRAARGEETVK